MVAFDRECCVLYKQELDGTCRPRRRDIVMLGEQRRAAEYAPYTPRQGRRGEAARPLPRPERPAEVRHRHRQAAHRLRRADPAGDVSRQADEGPQSAAGHLPDEPHLRRGEDARLIVDYIGIFDDVAQALEFDEKAVQQAVSNIDELIGRPARQVQKCLAFFAGVDRTVAGYEGLIAAQQCLPNNDTRDAFAADFSVLGTIWEALSPDPCLTPYETDYRWLAQVYESVKPPSGNGSCSGTRSAPRPSS